MSLELFQDVVKIFLYEVSFWCVIVGCVMVIVYIIKESNRRDLLIISACILLGLILRIRFGIYAPVHEKLQYIEIINNYYQNYLNNNFFNISSYYNPTFGFVDFFMNRVLYFFNSFNIYYIYYINIVISLFRGAILFYIVKLLFNDKLIGFFALLVLMLFPIEIRYAATEIQTQIIGLILLLFFAQLILYIKKQRIKYLIVLLGVCAANMLVRYEFTAYFLMVALISFFIVMYKSKTFKQKVIISIMTYILLISSFVCFFDFYSVHLGVNSANYEDMYWNQVYVYWTEKLNFFPNILYLYNYFGDHSPGHPLQFLKAFFVPIYFYFLLKFSFVLLFLENRKKYASLLGVALFYTLLIGIFSRPGIKHIRLWLPIFPLYSLLVGCVLFEIVRIFKVRKNYVIAVSVVIIVISSLWQNYSFLNMVFARKVEQDFLISGIKKIPENSLVLTLAEKNFEQSKFEKIDTCQYQNSNGHYVEGREFPSYLLYGRNIDVMDVCTEYNSNLFDSYDGVYYYRGLYAYYDWRNSMVATNFEKDSDLKLIATMKLINYDLHSQSVKHLIAGDSLPVSSKEEDLEISLFNYD